jgi:hypothetical protein
MYTRFALRRLPARLPLEVLESSPHACFGLTESLDISYCNPAWDKFARENGGGPEVLSSQILKTPFLRYLPQGLVSHFRMLFKTARELGRPQAQDYECSGPQVFRSYRMQIYPLQPGCGFAVINALRVAHPHRRERFEPDDDKYVHPDGLFHMCANCRRCRRADDPASWDWVPDYVQHPRPNVSHGVCPFCADYYYGVKVSPKQSRSLK